jgi:hypothetical protein
MFSKEDQNYHKHGEFIDELHKEKQKNRLLRSLLIEAGGYIRTTKPESYLVKKIEQVTGWIYTS